MSNYHHFDASYTGPAGQENCVVCRQPRDAPGHDLGVQALEALEIANKVRGGGSDIKRELRAGTITPAQAIHDVRSGVLETAVFVGCCPGWSRVAGRALCHQLWISEIKRIRDLTDRQRDAIIERVSRTKKTA